MRNFFMLCTFLASCSLSAQTVISMDSGHVRGLNLNDYQIAAPSKSEAPVPPVETLAADTEAYTTALARAYQLIARDSLTQAIPWLEAALEARPLAEGNYVLWTDLGKTRLALGYTQSAAEAFSETLKEQPEDTLARRLRAEAYLASGDANRALTDANVLWNIEAYRKSNEPKLLFLRAAAMVQLNMADEGERLILELLKREPQNTSATILLALCYEKKGRTNEALALLNLLLQAQPTLTEALAARGNMLYEQNMFDAAALDYTAFLQQIPNDIGILIARARTYINMGNKAAARRDLDAAQRLGVPRAALQHLYQGERGERGAR